MGSDTPEYPWEVLVFIHSTDTYWVKHCGNHRYTQMKKMWFMTYQGSQPREGNGQYSQQGKSRGNIWLIIQTRFFWVCKSVTINNFTRTKKQIPSCRLRERLGLTTCPNLGEIFDSLLFLLSYIQSKGHYHIQIYR